MNGLVESLMEELNCNVVFTIPLFGGIDVMESVVVTWIIMAIMMIASLILVRGLKVRNISKKQAALESGMSFIYDFFEGLLGKEGKDYIPYLITVVIYIGIANMIGHCHHSANQCAGAVYTAIVPVHAVVRQRAGRHCCHGTHQAFAAVDCAAAIQLLF